MKNLQLNLLIIKLFPNKLQLINELLMNVNVIIFQGKSHYMNNIGAYLQLIIHIYDCRPSSYSSI